MKKVLLLLCRGVEIFEAGAFHDVLGWSGDYGSEKIEVVPVGVTPEVICTFGLKIKPDMLLKDVDVKAFDALAIPGGFERFSFYEEAFSEPVLTLIREFAGAGKPVASICVGALPVACSGVLSGKKATTYHLNGGKRRAQLATYGVQVVDAMLVREGNITTSTSPATAVDVALALLADLTGEENARKIRTLMGFPPA